MTDATRIIAIAALAALTSLPRARPGLSVAADHHERAVRRRRPLDVMVRVVADGLRRRWASPS